MTSVLNLTQSPQPNLCYAILRKTKALQKGSLAFLGGKKYLKLESEEKRGQISFYYYTAELFNWPTHE